MEAERGTNENPCMHKSFSEGGIREMCSLSRGPIPWYWMSKVKVTNGSRNTLRCCHGRIALVIALAAEYRYQSTDNLLKVHEISSTVRFF